MFPKLSDKFIGYAMIYGSIRKIPELFLSSTPPQHEVYNRDTKKDEMKRLLIGHKLFIMSYSAITTPFLFPYALYTDINKLHIITRGEKLSEYGYSYKYLPDYMFS